MKNGKSSEEFAWTEDFTRVVAPALRLFSELLRDEIFRSVREAMGEESTSPSAEVQGVDGNTYQLNIPLTGVQKGILVEVIQEPGVEASEMVRVFESPEVSPAEIRSEYIQLYNWGLVTRPWSAPDSACYLTGIGEQVATALCDELGITF